ncbi:MAG: NAD(P)H-dependent oxidoreductase [Bacteroidota bacterium]|nr:NAD(P)H-dependent oxidoreductase [Bacteroidota bacterium]
MNVLIILGHPDNNSFNHALAETCITQIQNNGHSVYFHDLYKEQFNPLLGECNNSTNELEIAEDIKNHYFDLINSDGIIIIHPNWWGQPPAIVKGWIDRVLIPDVAYQFVKDERGEDFPKGLLKAKIGLVLNTSNTSKDIEDKLYKDPLETIWEKRIFNFCGVSQFERRNFRVVKDSNMSQRLNWLAEVRLLMDSYFPKA